MYDKVLSGLCSRIGCSVTGSVPTESCPSIASSICPLALIEEIFCPFCETLAVADYCSFSAEYDSSLAGREQRLLIVLAPGICPRRPNFSFVQKPFTGLVHQIESNQRG
jgi:hypothetical protein